VLSSGAAGAEGRGAGAGGGGWAQRRENQQNPFRNHNSASAVQLNTTHITLTTRWDIQLVSQISICHIDCLK